MAESGAMRMVVKTARDNCMLPGLLQMQEVGSKDIDTGRQERAAWWLTVCRYERRHIPSSKAFPSSRI